MKLTIDKTWVITHLHNVPDCDTGQSGALFGMYKVEGQPVTFQLFIFTLISAKRPFSPFLNFMNFIFIFIHH